MPTKKISRRKFRIGELAKRIGVEAFVVRFWEKEFGLTPTRSQGGQRFYSDKDEQTLIRIKELLYAQKFTISGAKKILQSSNKGSLSPKQSEKALPQGLASKLRRLAHELKRFRQAL